MGRKFTRKARPQNTGYITPTRCLACKKFAFDSRKEAKTYAKRNRLGGLTPYPCHTNPGWIHLGHLDPRVTEGRQTRRARYADAPGPSRRRTHKHTTKDSDQ